VAVWLGSRLKSCKSEITRQKSLPSFRFIIHYTWSTDIRMATVLPTFASGARLGRAAGEGRGAAVAVGPSRRCREHHLA
jgi:hypothetical protein